MLRTVNWVARTLGFAWLVAWAFVLAPPHGALNLPVQIAGYCLAGLGQLAWAWLDFFPDAAPDRTRALPVVLGVMAAGAGVAATAGGGGYAIIIFAFVAAMVAGSDTGLAAALAVTATGILAIEVSGLVLGDSYG